MHEAECGLCGSGYSRYSFRTSVHEPHKLMCGDARTAKAFDRGKRS
jgi:hypothetical protein